LKTENSNWYLKEGLIYLNHGSFGATPKVILNKFFQLCEQVDENPMKFYLDDYPLLLNQSRNAISDFINAQIEKIAFVDNATTGINAVMRSLLPLIKLDWEILTTNHYYPAVKNTLSYISALTGCKINVVELPDFVESSVQLFELITNQINEKTKLLVCDHISSISGMIFPVKELNDFCKTKGIFTMIDGAHAPGFLPLDLKALNPDWYTGNLHKWLFAPKGTAILYSNSSNDFDIHPVVISNNFGKGFIEEFDWVGTRNFCSWLTIKNCIEFYKLNFKFEYCRELSLFARELLIKELDLEPMAHESITGLMQSFWLPEKLGNTVDESIKLRKLLLNKFNIEVFLNPFKDRLVLRISSQIYNTQSHYEKLTEALKYILK
jgi:isopenicillin-N epimerase